MQKNDNIDPMLTKIFSERLDHCKKAHIKKCKDKKFSLSHGVKNTGNDDEHGVDNIDFLNKDEDEYDENDVFGENDTSMANVEVKKDKKSKDKKGKKKILKRAISSDEGEEAEAVIKNNAADS